MIRALRERIAGLERQLSRLLAGDTPNPPKTSGRSVAERAVAGELSSRFRSRHLESGGEYRTFEWTAVAHENRELCCAMAIDVPG